MDEGSDGTKSSPFLHNFCHVFLFAQVTAKVPHAIPKEDTVFVGLDSQPNSMMTVTTP